MTVETYFIMAEGNSVALRGCPTSITKAGPPSGYLFIYLFIYSFFDEQSQLDQPANTKISTAFCHFGYFTCSIIHLVSFFFFFFLNELSILSSALRFINFINFLSTKNELAVDVS